MSACCIGVASQVYHATQHPKSLEKRSKQANKHTLRIQSQHSLNSDIDTTEAVALEHDLAHLLAVPEGVHGGLGEEDLAAAGVDLHLVEEGVVPEVLHVVPLLDDAVLHGVGDLEHGAGGGRLVAAHDVLDGEPVRLGAAALLGPQDRPPHDRRELVFGEVLGRVSDL